jgi:hypothetical protein
MIFLCKILIISSFINFFKIKNYKNKINREAYNLYEDRKTSWVLYDFTKKMNDIYINTP